MGLSLMGPGGAVLDATTAVAGDIRSGKTAYNGEGKLVTGSLDVFQNLKGGTITTQSPGDQSYLWLTTVDCKNKIIKTESTHHTYWMNGGRDINGMHIEYNPSSGYFYIRTARDLIGMGHTVVLVQQLNNGDIGNGQIRVVGIIWNDVII